MWGTIEIKKFADCLHQRALNQKQVTLHQNKNHWKQKEWREDCEKRNECYQADHPIIEEVLPIIGGNDPSPERINPKTERVKSKVKSCYQRNEKVTLRSLSSIQQSQTYRKRSTKTTRIDG